MNMNRSPERVHLQTDLRPFEAIVEQTPDAIIFADCDGMILVWNRGAETVFGFSGAEVIGSSLDVIIPERFRRTHWEGFHCAKDSRNWKGRCHEHRSARALATHSRI